MRASNAICIDPLRYPKKSQKMLEPESGMGVCFLNAGKYAESTGARPPWLAAPLHVFWRLPFVFYFFPSFFFF